MDKAVLAQQLRHIQHAFGRVPARIIENVSDDQMIDSCVKGLCSGKRKITPEQLQEAIQVAKDTEHFFDLCDQLVENHRN